MNTLFADEPMLPAGFAYYADFISSEEERRLCEVVRGLPLKPFTFRRYEAKRKVANFGCSYHFDSGTITEAEPIPVMFATLVEKVGQRLQVPATDFAELLVTEYPVGAAISWHRDAPPFELIAGVSLASDCVFLLRPHEGPRNRSAIVSVPIQRGSLYVMQGPARNHWEHSIRPVEQVRYSITLRTLRRGKAPSPLTR